MWGMSAKIDVRSLMRNHLNFFRIHLTFFVLVPIVVAAIFYAVNGDSYVRFIDALFLSFSAATCSGLQSMDLSSLSGFQQALLAILTCFGNIVTVSWFMVFIRRQYFAHRFKTIISRERAKQEKAFEEDRERGGRSLMRHLSGSLTVAQPDATKGFRRLSDEEKRSGSFSNKYKKKLSVDMIQRVEMEPQPVNSTGLVEMDGEIPDIHPLRRTLCREAERLGVQVEAFDAGANDVLGVESTGKGFTATVGFDVPFGRSQMRRRGVEGDADVIDRHAITSPLSRASSTRRSVRSKIPEGPRDGGLGGFPYPHELVLRLIRRFFPNLAQRLMCKNDAHDTEDMPSPKRTKKLDYFTFEAVVGRNSRFLVLSEDEIEELGGVEYRALTALLWIVPAYWFGLLLTGFVIFSPYMSMSKWSADFSTPALHRDINPVWFSFFQSVSAFGNTGLSLVDQSMVPFQTAYPMIFFMSILICAGNTAYPCFLRFFVWCMFKLAPKESQLKETLHFLLDHPRRCFVYLFPSYQTWCLLTVVLILNFTDYFFFLVLDIGNAVMDAIPVGVRFAIGWLQAISVRTGGFAVVSLASIAPGVQVGFLTMMYISAYPIALSVRSTNVYEERSLGIYEEDSETLPNPVVLGSKLQSVGHYLGSHMRRQLSFDMWWLASALFVLCIIERDKIMDDTHFAYVNIFSILFELVSAYGTVGLSIGVTGANYALSGVLSPLSKLVIILVMIRGRHRGLPAAIDRAIMLPYDLGLDHDEEQEQEQEQEQVEKEKEGERVMRGRQFGKQMQMHWQMGTPDSTEAGEDVRKNGNKSGEGKSKAEGTESPRDL